MLKGSFVICIDDGSQHMHTAILLLPILLSIPPHTELLADYLLQRLHGVFFNVAGDGVIAEGRIMVPHFIYNQRVVAKQVNGFLNSWIVRVVRRCIDS